MPVVPNRRGGGVTTPAPIFLAEPSRERGTNTKGKETKMDLEAKAALDEIMLKTALVALSDTVSPAIMLVAVVGTGPGSARIHTIGTESFKEVLRQCPDIAAKIVSGLNSVGVIPLNKFEAAAGLN